MTATYRNPWYTPRGNDPEYYTTSARPRQVDDVSIYHRIPGRSGYGVWDYVRGGVCISQRAGCSGDDDRIRQIIREIDAYRLWREAV
jgi:hypothetical protein